ncbi:MAG: endonuclease/exonuclease/phosphatase family protein [Flavobacteriaceae bacterium]
MRKKIIFPLLVLLNSASLVLQLLLTESIGISVHAPLLTLFLPFILLWNVLFFVYWIIRFRWPFLMFFGMLLLSFNQLGLIYQRGTPRIETTPGIHVMSYNVRLFNRYGWLSNKDISGEIQHFIQQHFPEVICFQEFSNTTAPSLRQYPHRYFSNGLAIYARHPIVTKGTIENTKSKPSGIYADLKINQDTLRVYNLHMESFRLDHQTDSLLSTEQTSRLRNRMLEALAKQEQQLKNLLAFDQNNTHPSVLCVDLNNNAFSETYKGIATHWTDAFTLKGKGLGATYSLAGIPMRIDFIFTSPALEVLQFRKFNQTYSDHKPIMIRLKMPQ